MNLFWGFMFGQPTVKISAVVAELATEHSLTSGFCRKVSFSGTSERLLLANDMVAICMRSPVLASILLGADPANSYTEVLDTRPLRTYADKASLVWIFDGSDAGRGEISQWICRRDEGMLQIRTDMGDSFQVPLESNGRSTASFARNGRFFVFRDLPASSDFVLRVNINSRHYSISAIHADVSASPSVWHLPELQSIHQTGTRIESIAAFYLNDFIGSRAL